MFTFIYSNNRIELIKIGFKSDWMLEVYIKYQRTSSYQGEAIIREAFKQTATEQDLHTTGQLITRLH